MLKRILLAASFAAALFAPISAQELQPAISLEDRALLRCAAAFAILARAQENGDPAKDGWPEVSGRGREFFVRALAQVMDHTGLDREGIARAASLEAKRIEETGELDKIMPSCLVMLDASGL